MDGTDDDACSDGLSADHHLISNDHNAGNPVHCSDSGNLQQQQQTMYKQGEHLLSQAKDLFRSRSLLIY